MTQEQINKLFLPWDQVEDWVEYQTIDKDGKRYLWDSDLIPLASEKHSEWLPTPNTKGHCMRKSLGEVEPESLGLDWRECMIKRERPVEKKILQKVFVEVRGGTVVNVRGTIDCEVVIVDWDNMEREGDIVDVSIVCAEGEGNIVEELGISLPG